MRVLKDAKNKIKWFLQRGKRRYADIDVWNIDYWFLTTVPKMLEQLKETAHGYPCNMTREKWNMTLDMMIYHFREANEDTCSKQIKDKDITTEKLIKLNQYQNMHLKKGFNLFTKYFRELWD